MCPSSWWLLECRVFWCHDKTAFFTFLPQIYYCVLFSETLKESIFFPKIIYLCIFFCKYMTLWKKKKQINNAIESIPHCCHILNVANTDRQQKRCPACKYTIIHLFLPFVFLCPTFTGVGVWSCGCRLLFFHLFPYLCSHEVKHYLIIRLSLNMHLDQYCETNPLSHLQSVNTCPVLPSGLMNGQTNPGVLLMQATVLSINQWKSWFPPQHNLKNKLLFQLKLSTKWKCIFNIQEATHLSNVFVLWDTNKIKKGATSRL